MINGLQDSTALKRLVLSRYFLGLAVDHAKSSREVDTFATVNLLHEAVETFLVAAAAHVNAPIGSREEFAGYLNKIDLKIAPLQLPFRSSLIRLNKARVMAKHDSVVPDRNELPGFVTTVREFLEEASVHVFRTDFRTVSLIDALPSDPQRELLQNAQNAFQESNFAETLIFCRKAIYLQYEKDYDAKPFLNSDPTGLASFLSKVPFHARSAKYVMQHVKEPTDYIILDHSRVDSDLTKDGLDNHQFWNIWRLTPRVYLDHTNRWIVRYEPDKVEGSATGENAAYVLENTVDHFIALARIRARQKVVGPRMWTVKTGPTGARLFERASESSNVTTTIPPSITLNVDAATESLDGGVMFWKVMSQFVEPDRWYFGYVLEAELQF